MSTTVNPPAATTTAGTRVARRVVQSTWIAAGAALVLLAFVWGQTVGTAPLTYQSQALQNLANVMAPLIAIALFIERAVEVVISSWRDEGANHLKNAAQTAKDPTSAAFAQAALNTYRHQTQTLSFITSFTISAVAAMAGVRAVAPLVQNAPTTGVFYAFDVALTALLLAGGADGLHQIVTTFTGWLDATKQKIAPTNASALPSTATASTAAATGGTAAGGTATGGAGQV